MNQYSVLGVISIDTVCYIRMYAKWKKYSCSSFEIICDYFFGFHL